VHPEESQGPKVAREDLQRQLEDANQRAYRESRDEFEKTTRKWAAYKKILLGPDVAAGRIYLDSSYAQRFDVMAMGALWDAQERARYIPEGWQVQPFARYLRVPTHLLQPRAVGSSTSSA
jgi:hypothetical protein